MIEHYEVMEGLRHIRYDFEDSKTFMNRVMANAIEMKKNSESIIMKWELPANVFLM